LLGLRAAPKEDSGLSTAELVLGGQLRLPSQPLSPAVPPPPEKEQPTALPLRRTYSQVATAPPPHLAGAQLVFIRRGAVSSPLQPLYDGPYKVLEEGPKFFKLQLGERQDAVSVDRLKPYSGAAVPPAVPPRRGRPSAVTD